MFGSAIAVPEIDIATNATPIKTTGKISRDGEPRADRGRAPADVVGDTESIA
ncbi:hypothetical protein GCM10010915_24950 [Microbacterium faecale]|uniref:Uncharacterized protein n=1 Tax=Microbacterium faecale TaxID=1804630 RepID=A0A917DIB9_9MICO|nr:hypothetical protein GCM10010915_24950 [Microbacterium faecale]